MRSASDLTQQTWFDRFCTSTRTMYPTCDKRMLSVGLVHFFTRCR